MPNRTVTVTYKADVGDAVSSVGTLATANVKAASAIETSAKKHDAAFKSISNKAALGGAAVAVGIGLAVSAFANFDKEMSAAAAATDVSGESLTRLREAAITAGKDTQFSATEAASAITSMGKAGVSAADILGGGLTGALSLAAAGQLDVGRAGDIAATAMTQFGLAGKDLPHIADLLAAGAGKAQGSVDDLAVALDYVGPVAHSMGISIEESTGILAEFASAGLTGEKGGTAFRGMLSSLLSPSELAAKTMKELGINLYDASGQFIGMQATADVLQQKLGGLDEATRNQALGQIFGNAQLAAATVLYQGGGAAVADWTNKVNDAGFAQEQAAKLMDNLAGDIEKFSGSVETAFISAGSGGNDALRSIVQGATSVVNILGEIPGPVSLAGAALAALALVGPKAFLSFRQYKSDLNDAGLSLDRISERAPRVGRALEIAGKAAKGFGVALAATAIASKAFGEDIDHVGTEQLTRDLLASRDAVGTLDKTLAASTGTGTMYASGIASVGDALRTTFSPITAQSIDQTTGSIFAAFGGRNTSDLHIAAERFGEIDAALANLVTGGHASEAANVMAQIQQEAAKQGISVDQLKAKFPAYAEALAAITNASGPAKDATSALATAQADAAQSAQDAAAANDALLQSLSAYASLVLGARDSAREYEAAVDAANDALKENGATLDITTEKGRNNQAALDAIAASTLGLVTHTFEARDANTELGAAVGTATDQVSKGRDAFIDIAGKMGLSKDAASALADQLGLTKGNVERLSQTITQVPDKTAKVDADITPAQRHLEQVQARMDGVAAQRPTPVINANPAPFNAATEGASRKLAALDRSNADPDVTATDRASGILNTILGRLNSITDKNVTVTTRYQEIGSPSVQAGIRHATGGLIEGAGTGTSDSIPTRWLSNGEFVVNAKSTADNLALLWSINRGEKVQKYAEGGVVGSAAFTSPTAGRSSWAQSGPFEIVGTLSSDWGPVVVSGQIQSAMSQTAMGIRAGVRR